MIHTWKYWRSVQGCLTITFCTKIKQSMVIIPNPLHVVRESLAKNVGFYLVIAKENWTYSEDTKAIKIPTSGVYLGP